MSRIFTVAQSEFTTLVRTKAFIIGLLLMPVITAGAIGFQVYAQRHSDREDHALVVLDHTGALASALVESAAAFNANSVSDTRAPASAVSVRRGRHACGTSSPAPLNTRTSPRSRRVTPS